MGNRIKHALRMIMYMNNKIAVNQTKRHYNFIHFFIHLLSAEKPCLFVNTLFLFGTEEYLMKSASNCIFHLIQLVLKDFIKGWWFNFLRNIAGNAWNYGID